MSDPLVAKALQVIEAYEEFGLVHVVDYESLTDLVYELREVAARAVSPDLTGALVNWFDTTHGNEFGHDHHCPAPWNDEPHIQPIFDGCTCGWSDVQRASQARAVPATGNPEVIDAAMALLSFLAVFEDRMLDPNTQVYECSKASWDDLTAEPKRLLHEWVARQPKGEREP